MRKIIAFLLLLSSGQIFSQDVIIKRNGEELKAKVVELTETTVKYKPEDNLDGPVYNIPKSEVFKIKYANGKSDFLGNVEPTEKKVETPPTEKKVIAPVTVVPSQTKYDSLMRLSRGEKTLGIVCAVTGPVCVVSGAVLLGLGVGEYSLKSGNTSNSGAIVNIACGSIITVCGTVLTVLAPVMIETSKKHKSQAEQYKGQVYISMPSLRLSYFSSRAGFGIGTTITF